MSQLSPDYVFPRYEKASLNFMKEKVYRLFSDGACRGNPGVGGAGAVVMDADGKIVWEGKQYLGCCTNNIAEYEALILGLQGSLDAGCKNLEVYLDSELLARQINGVYRVKNENLQVLMRDIRRLLSFFDTIKIQHVLRCHNARADKLANQAIDEKDKT